MPRSKPFPTKRANRPKRQPEAEGERPDPQPGTVTAIQSQVNDLERVSIFIDGSFAVGVARDVADAGGLRQGQVLDDAGIADLLAREHLHKATSAALNFLAYRPRSEGEIRHRLQRGGYPEATIDAVIDKLRSWHYVDDEDFARRWIENRAAHRPRGARLLAQELQAKGIDRQVMAEALAEAELDEASDALTLARQRSRQLQDLEPDIRERRLTGFLARRGYGFDVIRATLEALREEPDDELPPDPA
ncbi:MAG: RecX family transcriptional regulator [Chloroflexia bacterium]|nr:RecX family transcriptional regulator [Chloroflexia bacterium]